VVSGIDDWPYLQYVGTSSTIRDLVSLADKIVGPGQLMDIRIGRLFPFSFP